MSKIFRIIGLILAFATPLSVALTFFDVNIAMSYLLGLYISKYVYAIYKEG